MFCRNCGAQITDTSVKFCPNCGASLAQPSSQQTMSAAPAAPAGNQAFYGQPGQSFQAQQTQPIYTRQGQYQQQYQQPQYQQSQYQQQYRQTYQQPYQQPYQQMYQQPQYQQPYQRPVALLKTNKTLVKFIFLSLITFGIYGLVIMSNVSTDINVVASRYDGKKTMHYCLLFFLIGWLTLGIGIIVWYHKISARMGNELKRRGIAYDFGASTYWLWSVLGSLIIVGPFIYTHKLFKSCNLLCDDYNRKGC